MFDVSMEVFEEEVKEGEELSVRGRHALKFV